MANPYYYLYCLKDKTGGKFSLKGMDRKKVHTLPYKGIEAVVTKVDSEEFNPKEIELKLKDLKWAEEKIRNHEAIIREAMEAGPVIPLKFLTLYKSGVKIKDLLRKQYKEFRTLLRELRGKSEWGLKVYVVNGGGLAEKAKKDDVEIAKMKEGLIGEPEGAKYFLEKKLAEKITEKVNARLNKYRKDIFEAFLPFSVEEPVINKILPPELSGQNRELILNVSYLIPTEKAGEFQRTVKRLHEYYSPEGLWLEYTGPWPPYSFVNHGDKNENKI